MNKAVIFLNGDKTDVSSIKKVIDNQTLIIGCDGGTKHAIDLGIIPHVVLGDMDSISNVLRKQLAKKKVNFVAYPTQKDSTDAELALLYAVKHGCNQIILTGIFGTRIDHMLATVNMLSNPKFTNIQLQIIEGNQDIHVVREHIKLRGKKGNTVSLIPLGSNAIGITTKNLSYSLRDDVLQSYGTRGVSNIMTKDTAEISFKKGVLLVIQQK